MKKQLITTDSVISNLLKRAFLVFVFSTLFVFSGQAQLIINEISQGPSGTKEYVEFLVVGTPTCSSIPCVDLRGYYIDDNNGSYATGAGTGIAQGCVRFKNTSFWSCVPIGTLIVIYNDGDANSTIPADDLTMADGNCRLIIPASNCTLLETHSSEPSLSSSTYPTSGFTSCGDWSMLAMANGDDSFQALNASGSAIFSVSWGNNNSNALVYFSGTSTGTVAYMTNSTDNNPTNQSNWTRVAVSGHETPGAPNNSANAAWIHSMNNSCSPLTPLTLSTTSTNASCTCDGSISVSASGGMAPYTYSWSSGGGTTSSASGLCAGTYTVTVTGANGCSEIAIETISSTGTLTVSVNSETVCAGQSATLTATGATSYTWSSGATTASITKSPTTTTTYTVTGTSGNCTATVTGTITVSGALAISVNSATICAGQSATLTATGADAYVWSSGGATTDAITKSPTSTTTYTVTGTSNGCSGTATGTITVGGALSISVNSATICAGQSATLTATGADAYVWSSGGAATDSITKSPTSTTTYTVTGTSNGCSGTATGTITVGGALSISVNSATICAGQSATLTATGADTYVWSNGGATTDAITKSPTTTTTYTVTGTSNGCSGTASGTITVGSSLSISVNSASICAGQSATLTATGADAYVWSTGATTDAVTESPAATETYTVTGTSNGCSGTASGTITVGSSLFISVNSASICAGQSATLTATGAEAYVWSTGATTDAITESPAATETYTVTGTSNGCSGTATGTITVGSSLSISVNSVSICAGQSATLTATGADAYVWSSGATTDAITESPATTATYTVTATSNGCAASAISTVTVMALPVVEFMSDKTLGCETFCVAFTDNSFVSSGSIVRWNWDFGDGQSSSASNPQHCYTEIGKYSVSLSVATAEGCQASVITADLISRSSKPTADFSIPLAITTADGELVFTNNSNDAENWNWNFGDSIDIANNTSNLKVPSHIYSESGNYCVSLIASNLSGCADTATRCFDVKPYFTFYVPNTFSPNNDGKNDEFYGAGANILEYELSVFDRWGKEVFHTASIDEKWNGKMVKAGNKDCQQDSYVYIFVVRDANKETHQFTGTVTLVR